MFGVVALGALEGIAIAVALAMLVLLYLSSRPAEAILGRVEGLQGFRDVTLYEGATPIPGLVLYQFGASIIFFNAPHFKRRALAVADANAGAKWLIIDGAPILHVDSTGADTIVDLADELKTRGMRLAFGGVAPRFSRCSNEAARSPGWGRCGVPEPSAAQ